MSNASDFIIENGVLTKYVGPGGDVEIPEGVTSIGESAFDGCKGLTTLTIPERVQRIGSFAFRGCCSMTTLSIPNSVTNIGWSAFERCSNLLDIKIPERLTEISGSMFDGCRSLTSITIPAGVTSIGSRAFFSCSSLVNVTIPESVTSIGSKAFSYCQNLTSVTIPAGVTNISKNVFENCSSLTSVTIPESVMSIGDWAFSGCISLMSVTISSNIASIGDSAFYGCRSLKGVNISSIDAWCKIKFGTISANPLYYAHNLYLNGNLIENLVLLDGVTSIGGGAFCGCTNLASVTIPSSVISIGNSAFFGCTNLTNVTIPGNVISIGNSAFYNCSNLTSVTIQAYVKSIGARAFSGCPLQIVSSPQTLTSRTADNRSFGLILTGEKAEYRAYSAKTDTDNVSEFVVKASWTAYDLELINNGPKYKYSLPARLLGALGRLLNPVELSEENRAMFIELLNKNAKKLVPLAEMLGDGELIKALFSLGILEDKNIKAVKKLLAESATPALAALAAMETTAAVKKKTEKKAEPTSPLAKEYAEKLKEIKGNALIKKMKLIGTAFPKVLLQNGSEAPEEIFRFLLASYGSQLGGHYHFVPEADKAAELLRYDSLCEAMDTVSNHLDGPSYPAVIPLLCRFGNASQIRALTEAWKDWIDWSKYSRRGRNACEYLLRALPLSDTREAVVWLEKYGTLGNYLDPGNTKNYYDMSKVDWEDITGDAEGKAFVRDNGATESEWFREVGLYRFAKLRGISLADVYEQYLFDFGFDAQGKKVYDLGVTTVEASIDRELKLSLYDTVNKKKVRGMPKKGIDPAVQKKAADDLADLRGNIKKAVKIKTDQLFADYLNGKTVPADAWQKSYLNNPLLRNLAELLVWEQDGSCFTLDASGLIDSTGTAYMISEKPIRLAHPMEMKSEDVAAWQKYYTAHNLKQPFPQVWEPVYEQSEIREDRYKDCPINVNYLKSQSRRGIHVEWWENYWTGSHDFRIQGFEVDAREADREDGKLRLEIVSLRPLEWNRRANMVIAFLDRITVWDRVKKDDVRVMDQVSRFTLAQITEMIQIAQEANAVNVLALLLEYKNAHFADFDPMDEFTLEW